MEPERVAELAWAEKDGRLVVLPDGEDNAALAATVGKADISRVWCGGDNDLLVGLLSVLAGQVADKLGVKYGALLAAMMSKAPIKAPKEADEALAQENGRLRAENKRLHEENFWLTGGLGREEQGF